jgi:hypothetical protein
MWPQILRSVKSCLSTAAVLIFAGSYVFCGPAWSQEFPYQKPTSIPVTPGGIQGGGGGSPFWAYCPGNTFMEGVTGNADDKIDKMQLFCAGFSHKNGDAHNFASESGQHFIQGAWIGDSPGGSTQAAECLTGFIKAIHFNTRKVDNNDIIDHITLDCADNSTARYPSKTFGPTTAEAHTAACPSGSYMLGLTGRMGSNIDALQGMCAGMPIR